MQIIKCDRCGVGIINYSCKPISFPVALITLVYSLNDTVSVDLCSKCKGEFIEWLKEKESDDEA
jgi:hypothetical protein